MLPTTLRRPLRWVTVAYHLTTFVLTFPPLVLHELAHYLGCLPWGGPDGIYGIYDTEQTGVLAHLPVGFAVHHSTVEYELVPGLAPLAYLAVTLAFPPGSLTFVGGAAATVVFLAGFVGLFDALHHVAPERYVDLFDPDGTHEYRLLIDLTAVGLGGDDPPTRSMLREEAAD